MGVFDEGCMGMYNAIIPDELLHPTGVFKERLSQSMLYAAMQRVSADEAQAVREWLDAQRACGSAPDTDPATELTEAQILDSAGCTSPPCGSPTISAATPSAFSTSRG